MTKPLTAKLNDNAASLTAGLILTIIKKKQRLKD